MWQNVLEIQDMENMETSTLFQCLYLMLFTRRASYYCIVSIQVHINRELISTKEARFMQVSSFDP